MDLYDAYSFVEKQIGLLEEELANTSDKAKKHFINARLNNFKNIKNLLCELNGRRQGITQ